jgi:hypothetical protein
MRKSDADVSKDLEDKKRRRVCAALQPTAARLGSPSAALRRQSKSPHYFVVLVMNTGRLFEMGTNTCTYIYIYIYICFF